MRGPSYDRFAANSARSRGTERVAAMGSRGALLAGYQAFDCTARAVLDQLGIAVRTGR